MVDRAPPDEAPLVLPMLRGDLDAVARIAAEVFPVAWPREAFERDLASSHAHGLVARPGRGLPICAFINYWVVAGELQIMNVATLPAARRQGHARRLLLSAFRAAEKAGAERALLEVRRSAGAAIALYEGLGFERLGVRQGYYSNDGEDAVVMQRALGAQPAAGNGAEGP